MEIPIPDGITMWPVERAHDRLASGRAQASGELGVELPVTDRAVQIDQQSGDRGGLQRRTHGLVHLRGQFEGARVPAAMTGQYSCPWNRAA